MKTSATARIQVTIEVDIISGGSWGHDCTVEQVHKQALDGARGRLRDITLANPGVRIISEMKVTMITHAVEK